MSCCAALCHAVQDLRVLREIAQHLIHYDAVTFLTYLESLRQSEGKGSVWLFHDATHTIFEQVGAVLG